MNKLFVTEFLVIVSSYFCVNVTQQQILSSYTFKQIIANLIDSLSISKILKSY